MESMAVKISILGSNGFLSNAIMAFASEHGWIVDLYGLAEPPVRMFHEFHAVDLMSSDIDCSSLIESDMIVYAIGGGIQSNLNEGSDLIYTLNVVAPVLICNRLNELGFSGVFVTFGSIFEVGESVSEKRCNENDVLSSSSRAPTDYIVSKRMLSRFAMSYCHKFKHWHFILPTIYGEGENPKRLIPYVVHALQSGDELKLTSGEQVRQYIYVGEVASMLGMAYEHKLLSGIYNVEGAEILTVREIVSRIASYLGKTVPEKWFGSAVRTDVGMKYLALNGSKLAKAIGFKARIHIEDVIKRYCYGA